MLKTALGFFPKKLRPAPIKIRRGRSKKMTRRRNLGTALIMYQKTAKALIFKI